MSVLINLFAVLIFLILGHLFVNIILKRYINSYNTHDTDGDQSWQADIQKCLSELGHNLVNSSQSTSQFILICLGIFIALFWGWMPAALLIVIGHLFINSTLNALSKTNSLPAETDLTNKQSLSFFQNTNRFICLIIYGFCALLFAVLIEISTHLLSLNSGAVFFILSIGVAIYAAMAAKSKVAKIILPILIVGFGYVLSNHLGLYVIGHWQPFESIEMLKVDERWVYAALVIFAIYFASTQNQTSNYVQAPILNNIYGEVSTQTEVTENNYNKEPLFFKRLQQVSHALNLGIVAIFIIFLVAERPLIDTPMHANSSLLPSYSTIMTIVLFFSVGSLLSLIQYLFSNQRPEQSNSSTIQFKKENYNISSANLIASIAALILLFVYASSTGLGAWQTHFNDWSASKSLHEILTVATDSISSTLVFLGLPESNAKNIIYSILFLNVLLLLKQLFSLCEKSSQPVLSFSDSPSRFKHSNLIILIIISGILLITGSSVSTWLLVGILSICGVVIFSVSGLSSILKSRQHAHTFIWLGACVSLLLLILTLPFIVTWFKTHLLIACLSIFIIAISLYALLSQIL